ncbi:MAG: FtsQ-type POTRA domain-containing protein [Nitrospirae bacterium]|nr:FtsQ-type POTRA domain-containing protein [Nitrospirota bacterium]
MRSTNNKRVKISGKRNGKQSPHKRSSKILLFLKGAALILSLIIFILGIAFAVNLSAHNLNVNDIEVSGNYHLSKEDVIRNLNINRGTNLLTLELNVVEARLRSNPWIKDVSLRKQMPDTLMIKIKEAAPKALLYQNSSTFLVEEEGNMLEEVMNEGTAFLPVIRSDSAEKNKKEIKEAIQLIDALDKKGILSSRESVEIRLNSYGPDMVVDGAVIKVGYGNYMEKLARWEELEPEVSKLGPTSYIDLRFRDRVIVKPLQPAETAETAEAKAVKASAAAQTGKPSESVKTATLEGIATVAKPAETAKTIKPAEPPKTTATVKPVQTAKKTKPAKKSKKAKRSKKAKK